LVGTIDSSGKIVDGPYISGEKYHRDLIVPEGAHPFTVARKGATDEVFLAGSSTKTLSPAAKALLDRIIVILEDP
jgi:hypothetical protein